MGGKHFKRYLALQVGVFGEINLTHSTGAEFVADDVMIQAVAVRDGIGRAVIEIRFGCLLNGGFQDRRRGV